MSVSKLSLYANKGHKEALGHFANIVKIAKKDGVIVDSERKLLERMARELQVTEIEFDAVMENPDKFPINSPVSYDERIERLYSLSKMVLVDGTVDDLELQLLRRVAFKLHFEKDEEVSKEAIRLIKEGVDLEDFTSAIKKVK